VEVRHAWWGSEQRVNLSRVLPAMRTQRTEWLLTAAHAFVTCVLVGLIWTIQVVHYPLFSSVGSSEFVRYEQQHTTRITLLVMPLMLAEVTLAGVLATSPRTATAAAPPWAAGAGEVHTGPPCGAVTSGRVLTG